MSVFDLRISAILVCSFSCAFEPTVFPAKPVIQGILVAGQAVQSVLVELGIEQNERITGQRRPIDALNVKLRLRDAVGATADFLPVGDDPIRYEANLSVQPNAVYSLEGAVFGQAISARVTVPSEVDIVSPTDSIAFVPLESGFTVVWRSGRNGRFAVSIRETGQFMVGNPDISTDTTVVWAPGIVPRLPGDTISVGIMSLDPMAEAFYNNATRPIASEGTIEGNIVGAFGVLGAATHATRVVVLR